MPEIIFTEIPKHLEGIDLCAREALGHHPGFSNRPPSESPYDVHDACEGMTFLAKLLEIENSDATVALLKAASKAGELVPGASIARKGLEVSTHTPNQGCEAFTLLSTKLQTFEAAVADCDEGLLVTTGLCSSIRIIKRIGLKSAAPISITSASLECTTELLVCGNDNGKTALRLVNQTSDGPTCVAYSDPTKVNEAVATALSHIQEFADYTRSEHPQRSKQTR